MNKPADPYYAHYAQLLGKTVTQIVICSDNTGTYGLKFDSGDIAWIQMDPEGNGPGFLAIES